MSEALVYANSTLTTEFEGRTVTLKTGEAWAADDPFVKARKDLFGDNPATPRRTSPKVETTARRGPGMSSGRITGR